MQVDITDEAEADLEEIADYIALDNPDHAVSFALELRASALALGNMPRATQAVSILGEVFAPLSMRYLIIFRVRRDRSFTMRGAFRGHSKTNSR